MENYIGVVPSDKITTTFKIHNPETLFLSKISKQEKLMEKDKLEHYEPEKIPIRIIKGFRNVYTMLLKNKCEFNHKYFRRRPLLSLMEFSMFLITFLFTKIVAAIWRIVNKLTLLLFVTHILATKGIEARPALENCANNLVSIEQPSLETFSALLDQMDSLQDLLKDICNNSPSSWQKLYNQARTIDDLALDLQNQILSLLEVENIIGKSNSPDAAPINDPAGGNGSPHLIPPRKRPNGRTEFAIEDASTDSCSCDCKTCCFEEPDEQPVQSEVLVTELDQPECPPEHHLEKSPVPKEEPEIADSSLEITEVNSEFIEALPAPAAITDKQEFPKEYIEPIPVLSVVIIDTMPILGSDILTDVKSESTLPPITLTSKMLTKNTPINPISTVTVTTSSASTTTTSLLDLHISDIHTTSKTHDTLGTLEINTEEDNSPNGESEIIQMNVVNDVAVSEYEADSYKIYDESTEDSIITEDEYIITYAEDTSTISPLDIVTDSYDYYYIAENASDIPVASDVALPLTVTPVWSDDATSYIIIDYDIKSAFTQPDLHVDETTISSIKTVSSTVTPSPSCFCPCYCTDPDAISLINPLKPSLQISDITKTSNSCSVPRFNCYLSAILIFYLFLKCIILKM